MSEREEAELLGIIQGLPFEALDFQGAKAKRRVVEYGWEYDFGSRKATTTRADSRVSSSFSRAGRRFRRFIT